MRHPAAIFSQLRLPAASFARWLLIAIFLLMAPALFAGDKNLPVRLRFWNIMYWGRPQEAIQELVKRYNEKTPGVYVDLLDVPQMEQKVFTATAGRTPPDIALFDRFRTAAYAERGAFMALDDLAAKSGVRQDEFFATCWGECVYRGKLYAIPFNSDVRVLFYNRKLFREAGLDPGRPPTTWNELREYSRKLTKRQAGPKSPLTQVGFIPVSGSPPGVGNTWLYLYGWQNGGEFMNEDGTVCTANDPKVVEALEWVTDFIGENGIEDLKTMFSGFGIREMNPFSAGKIAMIGEEGFLLSIIRQYNPKLDFGVAPLPWPEGGKHATWSGGFALVIPTGCEHPREAMDFIRYMTSQESQEYFGRTSEQIPANQKAAQSDYFAKDPKWRVFIEEMKFSRFRPVTAVGSLLWDELSRANEIAIHGKMTPKQALDDAAKNVQRDLNRILATRKDPILPWGKVLGGFFAIIALLIAARAVWSVREYRKTTLYRREALWGYLFALPTLAGLLIFTLGPIFASAVYSFCFYEVLTPARWVALQNYNRLITNDPRFWTSLWNTLFYAILSVPLGVIASLALAMLLNAKIIGRSFFRTLFYLPSIVPIVASSMLWLWLFNSDSGLINEVFKAVGIPPVPWLTHPGWAKPSLVLMSLWGIGGGMIIFLAGLQGVPRHLYESAMIDGAGPWRRFLSITLPMLSPTILFMLIMNTIGALQVFTQAYLMTNGQGGPLDSTLFYVFYLFRLGFEYFDMGYASAMAWIMFVLIVGVTALQFKFSRHWVHSEGA